MRLELATGLAARMRSMAFVLRLVREKLRNSEGNWALSRRIATITTRYSTQKNTPSLRGGGPVPRFSNLREADADVGALFEVDGIDETDLAIVEGEDHRHGANAFAEEAHAFEQVSVGDAATRKNNFFSRRQVFRVVDAFWIFHAHAFKAFGVLRFAYDQPCKNLSIESAQCCCGDDSLGSAAGSHHGVNAGADDRGGNTGGQVAVADQANARAGFANVADQFFVARAIEHDDGQIFDVAVKPLRDGFQVVGDRSIKIDGAFAAWADDHFFHVDIGSVE